MQNAFAISGSMWWLLAGLCLLIPLLIHLIQLYRHQKVRWAAMSFLLRSQQRSRRWLRLKQWLLIATRMSLLLLGLITISQVRCDRTGLTDYFGDGTVTEHLILLDDSYSMGQALPNGAPHSNASVAIAQLLEQLESLPNQRVSLLTFSQAQLWQTQQELSDATTSESDAPKGNPFLIIDQHVVTKNLISDLDNALKAMPTGYGDEGPESALTWARRRAGSDPETSFVVHLLSDFRAGQWQEQSDVWKFLDAEKNFAHVSFVDCGEDLSSSSGNLSLVRLNSVGVMNTTKTGYLMECAVHNPGTEAATNVVVNVDVWENRKDPILVSSATGGTPGTMESEDWQRAELPALLFEQIPAGETVVRQFPLAFSHVGLPVVRLTLPDDTVSGDNQQLCVVEAAEHQSVLVIDETVSQGSWFLQQSLNPAGLTGVLCQIESSTMLRRSAVEDLKGFKWIAMVDVPRLDEAALENLVDYVRQGGGLIWFVGPNANVEFYSGPLFRDGIFPVRLDRSVPTASPIDGEVSDLQVVDHPVFSPFLTNDQSQLDAVVFQRLWKVDTDTIEAPVGGSTLNQKVLASFRGKQQWPLMLEHQIAGVPDPSNSDSDQTATGRILTFLNTIDGQWNNWPQELTFPAAIMLMADYVAKQPQPRDFVVGSPQIPDTLMGQEAKVTATYLPQQEEMANVGSTFSLDLSETAAKERLLLASRNSSQRSSQPSSQRSSLSPQEGSSGNEASRVNLLATQKPGLQVLDWMIDQDGERQWQRQVSLPSLAEANLSRTDVQSEPGFDPQKHKWVHWNQLMWQTRNLAQQAWLRPMVLSILAALVLESLLARWAGGNQ